MSKALKTKKMIIGVSTIIFCLFSLIVYLLNPIYPSESHVKILNNLNLSDTNKQILALKKIAQFSNDQKENIKLEVVKYVEDKVGEGIEKGSFTYYLYTNQILQTVRQIYPQEKKILFLAMKNQLAQSSFLATRLLSFHNLFKAGIHLSPAALEEAVLLRKQILDLLPASPFVNDARLDLALALQIESAPEKEARLIKMPVEKMVEVTTHSEYLIDSQDRLSQPLQWSDKHFPPLLSDEWLVTIEHTLPVVGLWMQNQPVIRQIQEKIAHYYLGKSQDYDKQNRHFLALNTLSRARYYASNIPSIELSYELEKKRYDLFLAKRNVSQERLIQKANEEMVETLLMIQAIPQAEKVLSEDAFSSEFIQNRVPSLVKNAYLELAEFNKLQDEFEAESFSYLASFDVSSIHLPQKKDLLVEENRQYDVTQNEVPFTPEHKLTYWKKDKQWLRERGSDSVQAQLVALADIEQLIFGHDFIDSLTDLPILTAEKESDISNHQKAIAIATPWDRSQNKSQDKSKPASKKSPVDRLATKLVETTQKYQGKDHCARAWHMAAKKSTVSCHDRIIGSDKPIDLVVIPFNSDNKRLYAISLRPITVGDYNRYCLLSSECQAQIGIKSKLKRPTKKDDDLPGAGLDLSDVQESIAEYDEFCTISGTCTGTLGEQNNKPMLALTNSQVTAYLRWLSKTTGHVYRLPTTEERLFALRMSPDKLLALSNQSSSSGFYFVREIQH